MKIVFDGQQLEPLHYANKDQLQAKAPDIYERVKESVFWESNPSMAACMAQVSGTVLRGDIDLRHPDDWPESTFERIYQALDAIGRWLIFDGSLKIANSMYLDDGAPKVVVLGDLEAVGLVNSCGELHVEGTTKVTGAMYFDSGDGGFTRLSLAEPVGFIATSANSFSIDMKSRYFFDRLLESGFDSAPANRHEEIIQSAFAVPPKVVSREQLAAFFSQKLQRKDAAASIASGEGEYSWIVRAIKQVDSRAFAAFFDDLVR